MIEGLKELQKLELMLINKDDSAVIAKRQKTAGSVVDVHFSALTSLKLSPWQIRIPAEKTLSDYMPKLQKLNVCVNPRQAQSVMDLATLHTLTLNIICFHILDEFQQVEVRASSQLRFLKVLSSTTNNLTFCVKNTNVQYFTEGIHYVATPLGENADLDNDDLHGPLSDQPSL